MKLGEHLKNIGVSQAKLAVILSLDGEITPALRVKAHRLYHGRMPNSEDMKRIFLATEGKIDANLLYGLPRFNNAKKRA